MNSLSASKELQLTTDGDMSQHMGKSCLTQPDEPQAEDDDDDALYYDAPNVDELHSKYHDKLQMSYMKEHPEWSLLPIQYIPDPEIGHRPPTFGLGVAFKNSAELLAFAKQLPNPPPANSRSILRAFRHLEDHFKQQGFDVPVVGQCIWPRPPERSSYMLTLAKNYGTESGLVWRQRLVKAREIVGPLDPEKQIKWHLLLENFPGGAQRVEDYCPLCRKPLRRPRRSS